MTRRESLDRVRRFLRKYGLVLAFIVVVAWFTWTAQQSRNQAARDRRAVAAFIQSSATNRAVTARANRDLAEYIAGLSIHGNTCSASCVANKFSAFLSRQSAAQLAAAQRAQAAADYWNQLAQRLKRAR